MLFTCRANFLQITDNDIDRRIDASRQYLLPARYLSGQKVATSLTESAVNSRVAKRIVKNQQMRWSQTNAHLMLQVRAAMITGNLRQRLLVQPDLSLLPAHPILQQTPPLLRAA
jgi:hypothetical protein